MHLRSKQETLQCQPHMDPHLSTQPISVKLGQNSQVCSRSQLSSVGSENLEIFPAASSHFSVVVGELSSPSPRHTIYTLSGPLYNAFRKTEGPFKSLLDTAHRLLSILEPHTSVQPLQQSQPRVTLTGVPILGMLSHWENADPASQSPPGSLCPMLHRLSFQALMLRG